MTGSACSNALMLHCSIPQLLKRSTVYSSRRRCYHARAGRHRNPAEAPMNIITEPRLYLVGRQNVDRSQIDRFLDEYGMTWETDTEVGGEKLAEAGGRLCYLSYGKGRKTNAEYISNILGQKHGSVLEHAVWNFIIAGVSRSFTHELIRHRAGWAYSQLSQRYVDESSASYVEPDIIAEDPQLHEVWLRAIQTSRQAARSVLPNATETMIFVTANARALRHFIELRGSEFAEEEIRKVALAVLAIMQREAASLFGD